MPNNSIFDAPDLLAPTNTPATTPQHRITVQERLNALKRSVARNLGILPPANTPISGAAVTPSLTELRRRYSSMVQPQLAQMPVLSDEMSREQDATQQHNEPTSIRTKGQESMCNCNSVLRFLFS